MEFLIKINIILIFFVFYFLQEQNGTEMKKGKHEETNIIEIYIKCMICY